MGVQEEMVEVGREWWRLWVDRVGIRDWGWDWEKLLYEQKYRKSLLYCERTRYSNCIHNLDARDSIFKYVTIHYHIIEGITLSCNEYQEYS